MPMQETDKQKEKTGGNEQRVCRVCKVQCCLTAWQ